MAIPKQIFQTYKSGKLSWFYRWNIRKIRRKNPGYAYHFYDDQRILEFFEKEMPSEYLSAYKRLTIGAAKADFFRYAILYMKGGVYLDIDGTVRKPIDSFVRPDDVAVLTRETHPGIFAQWALIFDKGHPILRKTLEMVLDNIQTHRYPNDVHATTGPTVYSRAIDACIAENPNVHYRIYGIDYEGKLKDKFRLGKIFKQESKKHHWRNKQREQPIIIEG